MRNLLGMGSEEEAGEEKEKEKKEEEDFKNRYSFPR